jgi:hypothetical protein
VGNIAPAELLYLAVIAMFILSAVAIALVAFLALRRARQGKNSH